MFCKGCGKKIELSAAVCPYCGRPVEKLEGGIGFFDLAGAEAPQEQAGPSVPPADGAAALERSVRSARRSLKRLRAASALSILLCAASICLGCLSLSQLQALKKAYRQLSDENISLAERLSGVEASSSSTSSAYVTQFEALRQAQEALQSQFEEYKASADLPKVIACSDAIVEGAKNETVVLYVMTQGDGLDFQWQKQNGSRWTSLPSSGQLKSRIENNKAVLEIKVTAQTVGTYRCVMDHMGQEFDSIEFEVRQEGSTARP